MKTLRGVAWRFEEKFQPYTTNHCPDSCFLIRYTEMCLTRDNSYLITTTHY
jgi:hypothetical protein